jgi:hypothetical protein
MVGDLMGEKRLKLKRRQLVYQDGPAVFLVSYVLTLMLHVDAGSAVNQPGVLAPTTSKRS